MLFAILLSLQVLDKVINFMPETDDVSDDERCKEDDDDSGINFKFQKIEERGLSELVRQCFAKPRTSKIRFGQVNIMREFL
jgi:hypothetical protein